MRRISLFVVLTAMIASLLNAFVMTQASADVLPAAPTATPAAVLPNEHFTISGQVDGAVSRPVTVQYKSGSKWKTVKSTTTDALGAYSVPGVATSATRQYRAYLKAAQGAPSVTSDVLTVSVLVQAAQLRIERDCSGNDCSAMTATVHATITPAREGRLVALQYKSGSKWKQIGSSLPSDASGAVQTQLDLTGLSQWTARSYRVVGGSVNGSSTVTSPTVLFLPGPTELGRNVMRLTVDGGAYPSSKSKDYTGRLTTTVDGVVKISNAALEKFGVRGSSTSGYKKKPYRLKLASSSKVFDMKKSKSWTLLASYLDQSFLRDKALLDLGRRVDPGWTPDSRFTEVFVNSQYVGSYLLTESVKIDKDRVDVDEEQGMLMEIDGSSVSNSSLGFLSSKKLAVAFKDPDEFKPAPDTAEGVTKEKLAAIKAYVNAMESALYGSNRADPVTGYAKYIDVDSAVDYYLLSEFGKDNDADFYRSRYFSWDPSLRPGKPLSDGKLHFGPIWDFDRSAGNVSDTDAGHKYVASPTGWYSRGTGTPSGRKNYKTHWYVQLFKDPAFEQKVEARWLEVRDEFAAVTTDVDAHVVALGVGADNDRKRWASEAKRYKARGSTYSAEVSYLKQWYAARFAWMNSQLS